MRALLRETREAKGLSQTELGELLGMSQVLISRGEVGERKIDAMELRAMCRALEMDFLEFMKNLDQRLNEHEKDPSAVSPNRFERSRKRR